MTTPARPTTQPSFTELFSREEIAGRVKALAQQIDQDYIGRELLLIAVLKGSFLFVADLCREIQTPLSVDFMRLASYGSEMQSSGIVEVRKDLEMDIRGRDVIIVEDIIDSGQTLETLREKLLTREPASLRICTLIDKTAHRVTEVPVDYVGFTMEDGFIIGYGLDLDEKYRNFPGICLVNQS